VQSDIKPSRARRGSRGRKGNKRANATGLQQIAWQVPKNTDTPIAPLPPEGVAAIHHTAMRILEEVGVEFLNLEAVDTLRQAGCTILNETRDGALVKMDHHRRSKHGVWLYCLPAQLFGFGSWQTAR